MASPKLQRQFTKDLFQLIQNEEVKGNIVELKPIYNTLKRKYKSQVANRAEFEGMFANGLMATGTKLVPSRDPDLFVKFGKGRNGKNFGYIDKTGLKEPEKEITSDVPKKVVKPSKGDASTSSLRENKLIKVGIKYSDQFFEQLKKIYGDAYRDADSLEEFLDETKDYSISNPLETSGYKDTLTELIVSSTNNIKYSRPAQKALMQTIIRNTTGELIVNVGDDIKDGVRDIVSRGYREGKLNHVRVANEINHELDGINRKRARTIARTEIKRAQTTSNYVIAKERGANAYKYKCGATPCKLCKEDCGGKFPIDDLEHLPPRSAPKLHVRGFFLCGPFI